MTSRSLLSTQERLLLICESIRYCQRVRAMGMGKAAWTKALREPVFFLWECRRAGKLAAARFNSHAAGAVRSAGALVYDHAIPFTYVESELMALAEPNPDAVHQILERRLVACLITRDEDRLLTLNGLRSSMPADWDGISPLARYRAVDIETELNPRYVEADLPRAA
jgi:hypothetical protein